MDPEADSGYKQLAYDFLGARHLMTEPDELLNNMVPCGGIDVADAGDMTVMVGGLPHRGPALKGGVVRPLLFVVVTPMRFSLEHSYSYTQVKAVTPELVFAMLSKSVVDRDKYIDDAVTRSRLWIPYWQSGKVPVQSSPVQDFLHKHVPPSLRKEGSSVAKKYVTCLLAAVTPEEKASLSSMHWTKTALQVPPPVMP